MVIYVFQVHCACLCTSEKVLLDFLLIQVLKFRYQLGCLIWQSRIVTENSLEWQVQCRRQKSYIW